MGFKAQPFFRYDRLDHSYDSFRLCKLLPDIEDAPIRCELIHDKISTQTNNYNALSYTWGAATEQRWIRLNGKPYHIQPNLMQALRAIRKTDESITIWIDAICIDQEYMSERNHQVAAMGKIYRNAKCVLAWLGPAADDSDAFFDYLKTLGTAEGEEKKRVEEAGKRALVYLNQRPYWRRAWIKQELNLAKDITVHCGSRSHALESFFWFATISTIDEIEGYEDYILKIYLHRCALRQGKSETLEQLLHRYGNAECTNLLDRVFALVSMASDCEGIESKLVDYSISIPALYFGLLAHFEPDNVSAFASILQDALDIRRVQLQTYMTKVSENATLEASSPMEQLAFNYIRKIHNYMASIASGISVSQPDFIIRSYNAINPSTMSKDQTVFKIKGANLALGFVSTLLGFHFRSVWQKREQQDPKKSDEDWEIWSSPYTVEQVWKFMIVPTLVIDTNDEHIRDKKLIADVKNGAVKNHGEETTRPSIDILCYTLAELARREKFASRKLCLVDCRYVISEMYGFALMRPLKFKGEE